MREARDLRQPEINRKTCAGSSAPPRQPPGQMTTVLGRLVGGGPPGDQQGQDGKLLELADTRDEQEAAVAGTKHVQEEAMSPATDDAALASVITQVSRDQQTAPLPPAVQYAEQPGDEGSEVRSNWKNKFR